MELKWGEFKKLVEEQGVKDETPIAWIDINLEMLPAVKFYKDGSVQISDGPPYPDDDITTRTPEP